MLPDSERTAAAARKGRARRRWTGARGPGYRAAVDPSAVFAATPCNRFLGLRLVARTAERCEVELPVRAEFLQEYGVVQGGILTAVADMAAVYLLFPELGEGRAMTGIECTMHFLGAATEAAGPLRAVATPLRKGRTIAVCESEVRQAGALVAKGTFSFLQRDRRPMP
jgi:uncharacterized protein (TIGR00369 family)